jgi:hypothetical protein
MLAFIRSNIRITYLGIFVRHLLLLLLSAPTRIHYLISSYCRRRRLSLEPPPPPPKKPPARRHPANAVRLGNYGSFNKNIFSTKSTVDSTRPKTYERNFPYRNSTHTCAPTPNPLSLPPYPLLQ